MESRRKRKPLTQLTIPDTNASCSKKPRGESLENGVTISEAKASSSKKSRSQHLENETISEANASCSKKPQGESFANGVAVPVAKASSSKKSRSQRLVNVTIPDANASCSKNPLTEAHENGKQKRAGTITYMLLKNFMCHSYLEVKFENNVTIMIGKNGSGKSAVLTALIVGLGGKASLTNRGNSIRGFIKAGKHSGSVEIQLYNEGPMAYRPSVYGKRITIIRNFNASGASAYKIKAESGAIISTKVGEIRLITTSLNIQVDNPVCILTQDTSRNFLSSNDPKHKFTLFMRATRLETLNEEYKKISVNKRQSVISLEDKTANFKKMQEEIRRLKRKIDNHKSIASLRDKLKDLQVELVWSKVKDSEDELEHQTAIVTSLQNKQRAILDSKRKKLEELQDIKEKVRSIEQKMSEIKDSVSVQSRPLKDVERIRDELCQVYNEKRREKHLLQQTISSKNQDIEQLNQQIENANENMSRIEKEKMERLRNLSSMEEKIKGMEDHLQTAKNDLFQLKSDLSRKEDEDQNLLREMAQIDRKIENDINNLNALKQETGNTLLLYGRSMPNILKMIQQYKSRFKHLPRGPLGHYINLRNKKWAVAIEGFITPSMLSAFTVDNRSDNELLVEIFNKCCTNDRKPTIITSKFFFRKHDVRKNLVNAPQGCQSLYDAVEIEDPVVANCIVDQLAVEGILLIPDDKTAMELMSYAERVPKNCQQGITMKGDRYYPDPNYKTYASTYHRAQYLQVDTSEYIHQLESNIEQLKEQRRGIENQQQAFRNDMQQKLQRKNQLEMRIRKLTTARTHIRQQLEELKSSAEPEVANVQELESELNEIKDILREKTAASGKVDEELKAIKEQLDECDLKLIKLKKVVDSLESRLEPFQEEVRRYVSRQRELSTVEDHDDRKITEVERRLTTACSDKVIKQTNLEKRTSDAVTLGTRPRRIRIVPDIMSDVKDTESVIRRIETDSDNVDDVLQKYNTLNEKYKKASSLMESLKYDVEELTLAASLRTRHYHQTESYFVTYIKHSFKKVLEFRQFKGSLNINMEAKTLDLIVIPQQGSQGLTTTSNLSGGERSFSTVSFLYALWQCMEFPFYFLDEFDVYMDKLNRTKVIKILLHHANSCPQLQFVFLTPQDISFIDTNVAVLRMPDPERFNV